MPDNNTTAKFSVDISDLKKGIQEANRQIRLANAEFKAASASMDKWSTSTSGLAAKIEQTDKVLTQQKKILNSYKQEMQQVIAQYGENSKEADNAKIKYENQRAAVIKTQKALGDYKSALSALEKEQAESAKAAERQATAFESLEKTISGQENDLSALKSEYANVVLEQGRNSKAAQDLASQIKELSGELNENKTKLSEAEGAADEFDQTLQDTSKGGLNVFTVAVGNLVANVLTSLISGMKDVIGQTIEVGKAFDSSMSNVAALSGASAEDLQMLRDTAKEFGSTTKFSASEAADALGYMALAGWDAKTSASALGGVLDLAAASGMDLAAASDMVTDYMSAFGMEAEKSGYFADVMAYAQANANTNVTQLGEAFKNSAANMNAAGQDIETVTSFLAMMANQGLKGSEAGTALTAVMRDMTSKMKDGAIAIGDTSVQVMDAEGNYRDLTDIMKDVEAATNGMGDAEKATALQSTFTADSIKGLNLMLNAGVDEAAKFEEELRKSDGTAADMAKTMNDNLNGDLTSLGSKLEGVQIALYEKFEPALRSGVKVLDKLLDAVDFVINHSTEFIAVLTGMGAAIATYVAYTTALKVMTEGWKALTVVTKLQTAAQAALNFVMNLNPIGILIAAIAGLVAAFVVLWNKSEAFRNFWTGLWENILAVVQPVIDWIKGAFDAIVEFFQNNWQSILLFIINPFAGVFKYLYDNFEGFRNFVDGIMQAVVGFFTDAWENIKAAWSVAVDWFSQVWEGIKSIFSVVAKILGDFFSAAWNAIKTVWDVVVAFFQNVWNGIQIIFSVVATVLGGFFSAAWNAIKIVWNLVVAYFQNVWNGIKLIFSVVKNVLSGNFSAAWNAIKAIWDNVKGYFSNVWEGIKSIFSGVKDWFSKTFQGAVDAVKVIMDGLVNIIKAPINAIIRGINSFIRGLNRIQIPDWVPAVGGRGINIPEISELAQGGVLKRGQLGLLEGSGAEAVVPLENNKKWIAATAKALQVALTNEGLLAAGLQQAPVINNNYSYTQNNTSPKALDALTIYRNTNSLLFAAQNAR